MEPQKLDERKTDPVTFSDASFQNNDSGSCSMSMQSYAKIFKALVFLVPISLIAQPAQQHRSALREIQRKVCESSSINIHSHFDYERISSHWFHDQNLSRDQCDDRIAAFRNAVKGWSNMGKGSPFCRFTIQSQANSVFELRFGYMYSYLDGPWELELRDNVVVVTGLPRPPEPAPYGCGIPE